MSRKVAKRETDAPRRNRQSLRRYSWVTQKTEMPAAAADLGTLPSSGYGFLSRTTATTWATVHPESFAEVIQLLDDEDLVLPSQSLFDRP